ncbi:MAG: DEAD/DEAH box helicase [Alloprevotella sp.]|nr:DEAD/DEAH box helicase [Alloprevotella sp.]
MRFEKCTPIQARCIPPLLEGRDVIGIAQTGTGKTAAYLLPLLTLLKEKPHPEDAVNCLVMAPTRELAQQIDQALQGFGYYADIRGVAVYGGNDGIRYEQERRSLQTGADIVIATPGRLLTHIDLGTFDLSRTTHLVLDEADRMLDMGFSDDILKIVSFLPKERQTIMFSATMPDKIRQLARSVLRNPVEVRIAVSKPAEGIRQSVFICREADKNALVRHVFGERQPKRVIIFCSSKQKVKELNIQLQRKGYSADAMHSDLEQKQRDDVMLRFKAGRIDILVATDIVSRGIDIDDITLVLNYDVPRDPEDYVHRIGRTARAGREGRAVTLVSERDRAHLRAIEQLLEKPVPREALPEGMEAPPDNGGSYGGNRGRVRGRERGRSHQRSGRSRGGHQRSRGGKPQDAPRDNSSGVGQQRSGRRRRGGRGGQKKD